MGGNRSAWTQEGDIGLSVYIRHRDRDTPGYGDVSLSERPLDFRRNATGAYRRGERRKPSCTEKKNSYRGMLFGPK
ncbi:hypothetical protein NQ318_002918 [Aromia moschata]|uniref:Uncharacterized protein n=1 Tax=Aromia moschata TaxID=1265417 RepID=A0AAV8Y3G4_9CUCU|nr:hypothetical protein NQ318_002918 [Aromia moschata]